MFTTIPRDVAITLVENKLRISSFNYHGLTPEDIASLLKTILDNSFFQFEGKYYKQCKGLPMGSKLSGLLADIFMDDFETNLVEELHLCCYHRYVDDIFMLTTSTDHAKRILELFNAKNEKIQFDMELPDDTGKLSLLDFWVRIDNGMLQHGFYKKSARSSVMFSGKAAIPSSMKQNAILNEWSRIKSKCSSFDQIKWERMNLMKRLRQNDHVKIPNLSLTPVNIGTKRYLNINNDPVFYLNVPFISDSMNAMIKKTLKPIGLQIRLSHRTKRLKTIFQSSGDIVPTRTKKCEIKNCKVNSKLCYRSNVVYKIICTTCDAFYIGSTKRYMHTRVKEHLSIRTSTIFKHSLTCRAKWKFEIIASSTSVSDLRIKEAILINEMAPTLNVKEDLFSLRLVNT
jgi:hypothetical protein